MLLRRITAGLTTAVMVLIAVPATAIAPPEPETPSALAFAQIKMTGDEYISIRNATDDPLQLAEYRLEAFNNTNPLAKSVSTSTQQLPDVLLQPDATLLLSANPSPTCGAEVAGKLSVSLTDAGGYVQLVHMTMQNNVLVQQQIDAVSWSSTVIGDIQNVPASSKNPLALYYRIAKEDTFGWQLAETVSGSACSIMAIVSNGTITEKQAVEALPSAPEPPSAIISTTQLTEPAAIVPASNKGLAAPQITELLPNPMGTGTDSTDEFIELYNSNAAPFELSGYSLHVGTSTLRKYLFPQGTIIAAKAFMPFSSEATGITLSNTGSTVRLVDPAGAIIATSEPYKNAKDGTVWALAKGTWHWSASATPGAANIIKAASTKKAAPITKTSPKKVTSAGTYTASSASVPPADEGLTVKPIHGFVVALVATVAVLYGAYEYRGDVARRVHQFRAKLSNRGNVGQPLEGRGGN